MTLPILALFSRAQRLEVRRARTYLFRLALLGFILLGLLITALKGYAGFTAAPGLDFFEFVVFTDLSFVLLVGLFEFPSAITEEKEEGTLGLLRMTGLSPLALLLGKSTARLLTVLGLLAVQVPFTLLAITLGGVSFDQVLAAYATLGAFAILQCNLGLLCSVVARRTATAAALTMAALVAFLLGPAAVYGLAELTRSAASLPPTHPVVVAGTAVYDTGTAASPFHRCAEILGAGFQDPPVGFQVRVHLALGAAFFLLAFAAFDRANREERDPEGERRVPAATARRFRRFSAGRPWKRALAWKDFHFLAGGKVSVLVKGVCLGILAGVIAFCVWDAERGEPFAERFPKAGPVVMAVMLGILCLEAAVHASRVFQEETKAKTLSALMTLPLPVSGIVSGKILGCLLSMAPTAFWLLAGAAISPADFLEAAGKACTSPWAWMSISVFAVYLYTTAWLSLYVRWGAFLLAFLIVYAGHSIFGMIAMLAVLPFAIGSRGGGDDFMLWIYPLLATVGSLGFAWLLHVRIARRLEALAGE